YVDNSGKWSPERVRLGRRTIAPADYISFDPSPPTSGIGTKRKRSDRADDVVLPALGDSDDVPDDDQSGGDDEDSDDGNDHSTIRRARPPIPEKRLKNLCRLEYQTMKDAWETVQLPKLVKKAHYYHRRLEPHLDDLNAELQFSMYDRLNNLLDELLRSISKESELQVRCQALEPTLHRIWELEWQIELVQSPRPAKPNRKVAEARSSKQAVSQAMDEHWEDFISENDDDIDQWRREHPPERLSRTPVLQSPRIPDSPPSLNAEHSVSPQDNRAPWATRDPPIPSILSESEEDFETIVGARPFAVVPTPEGFRRTEIPSIPHGHRRKEIAPIREGAHQVNLRRKRAAIEKAFRSRAEQQATEPIIEVFSDDGDPKPNPKVIINLGHENDQRNIFVPGYLAGALKPHQIAGVQFLWKNIVMSNDSPVNGCILAHAMGLGKTLQAIVFIHTLLFERRKNTKNVPPHFSEGRVLIVVPPSLVKNWASEFGQWIPDVYNHDKVYTLTSNHKEFERLDIIFGWYRDKGILIVGFDLLLTIYKAMCKAEDRDAATFSNLAEASSHTPPLPLGDSPDEVDPVYGEPIEWTDLKGQPDPRWLHVRKKLFNAAELLVCDEGHLLKNAANQRNVALQAVQTRSRVLLTGTPLQNNLEEYWVMIDFVYPSFLGTLPEFRNSFNAPINNGLCVDSTAGDKRLSRNRMWVLTQMIESIVQRQDTLPLKEELGPKTELLLDCRLTDLQAQVYEALLENTVTSEEPARVLACLPSFIQLCGHPKIYRDYMLKDKGGAMKKLKSRPDPALNIKLEGIFRNFGADLANADHLGLHHSNKALMTLRLVKAIRQEKLKVLIFSTSIPVLAYLERAIKEAEGVAPILLTGETSAPVRHKHIADFQDATQRDQFKVFLISTRAGGLGINLQAATRVIVYDIGWNPSDAEQAIARSYRYGQKEPVIVYRLQTHDTMEATLYKTNVQKLGMFKQVVDNVPTEKFFTKLELKEYFRKPGPSKPWAPSVTEVEELAKSDVVMRRLLDESDGSYQQTRLQLAGVRRHDDLLKEIDDEMNDLEMAEGSRALEQERRMQKHRRDGIDYRSHVRATVQKW
ncbi:hypothetical protein HKX48_001397, partial [Thoreauomyces humboldtii]